MSTDESEIPPPMDGEINQIPDLSDGDRIRVRTVYNSDPNRNLTVVEPDPEKDDILGLQAQTIGIQHGLEGYILDGYGTQYHLTAVDSITKSWRRVLLVWASRREGVPVEDIEVLDDE